MSYPRFPKIIIDYFMSNDQSISRRNKMFWHTAQDETLFTSISCIARHEDTQVYGAILPKYLTNQAMLESKAYKTYYAFAYGEKIPKPKYVQNKSDSDTSPKQKPVQAIKGTRIKTKVKVAKSDKKKQHAKMPKAKGLDVMELTLGSKVPNEQHLKTSRVNEATGTIPGVPDVPIYESKSEKESWGDSGEEDEDDENNSEDKSDDRIKIHVLNQSSIEFYKEEEKIDDEETMDEEEDDEVTKELYDDVNVNLGNEDTKMRDVQGALEQNVSQESRFEQVGEDAHVTLTPVLDTQKADEPVQSSFLFTDFTSKILNLENPSPTDNGIDSLFNDRVANLEKDLSELKQVDQYAQAISSIPTIVDRYMDSKLGEAIHKTIQSHNAECRKESQAKKQEYIDNVDSTVRTITIEEVKTQLSKILPKVISAFATPVIEINFTKSLEAVVLARWRKANHILKYYKKKHYDALVESYNTDKDIFKSYGEVFSLKKSRDDKDKDRDPSTRSHRGMKRRKSSKEAESSKDSTSKEKKSSSTSKDTSQS
nr:hypothetical protein [Tanacetum cinerariifolium]